MPRNLSLLPKKKKIAMPIVYITSFCCSELLKVIIRLKCFSYSC